MKKLILALTVLSLAGLFSACQSAKEETVEDRLRDEYGWKGTALPKAAPDPQTVITDSEDAKTEPKDAEIVSTIDLKDTVQTPIDEQPPLPPKEEKKFVPSEGKKSSVKTPSKARYELTGESKVRIVKKGETLSSIARNEYHDGHLWGFIFRANKELLKGNPNLIRPGMKITIPGIRKVSPGKETPKAGMTEKAEKKPADVKAAAPAVPAASQEKKELPKESPSTVLPAPVEKAPEAPRTN